MASYIADASGAGKRVTRSSLVNKILSPWHMKQRDKNDKVDQNIYKRNLRENVKPTAAKVPKITQKSAVTTDAIEVDPIKIEVEDPIKIEVEDQQCIVVTKLFHIEDTHHQEEKIESRPEPSQQKTLKPSKPSSKIKKLSFSSLQLKGEVFKLLEKGETIASLSEKHSIPESTICEWLSQAQRLTAARNVINDFENKIDKEPSSPLSKKMKASTKQNDLYEMRAEELKLDLELKRLNIECEKLDTQYKELLKKKTQRDRFKKNLARKGSAKA